MKEYDLDLIELEAIMILLKPEVDNRISGKRIRFFKAILHKLELQTKIRNIEIKKELTVLTQGANEKR